MTNQPPQSPQDDSAYGQYPYTGRPPTTNGKAVASMVLGIVSLVSCCMGLVTGPLAIIFAVSAKKEIAASRGAQTGEGMATAGLVMGIIGTAVYAPLVLMWVFGVMTMPFGAVAF